MIVEIPEKDYTVAEMVEVLDLLESVVPLFSKFNFEHANLWPLLSRVKMDNMVKQYLKAVEKASVPPYGEKWWPMMNATAALAVRVRLHFAMDFLRSSAYNSTFTRGEMFSYIREIVTTHWRADGFSWLVEQRANLPIYWRSEEKGDKA